MLLIVLIIFGVYIFYDTYLKSYFLINATLNNYLYTVNFKSQQSYFRLQRMTTSNDMMICFTIIEIIHQSNENGWNNNLKNLKRNKVPS